VTTTTMEIPRACKLCQWQLLCFSALSQILFRWGLFGFTRFSIWAYNGVAYIRARTREYRTLRTGQARHWQENNGGTRHKQPVEMVTGDTSFLRRSYPMPKLWSLLWTPAAQGKLSIKGKYRS